MTAPIIVGEGTVQGWIGDYWAVDNGAATVYIAADDMLLAQPRAGDQGVLTYEFKGASVGRINRFRGIDDPLVKR